MLVRGQTAFVTGLLALAALAVVQRPGWAGEVALLNASYDPTRELYREYNAAFARYWRDKTGDRVTIRQAHGGSSKMARAVIDGLRADVVTLALAFDIDAIAEKGQRLSSDWERRLPHNSSPYTSAVVFLVRQGNPKKIVDWNDLARPGVSVITANPKTSGGARWNYLAAYGYALQRSQGDHAEAREFVAKLFANVPVLDTGARGAATTFVSRGVGDALITWENEALLALREAPAGQFVLVVPSTSILAEPPVAVVDRVVEARQTGTVARAYLERLYSEEGQQIAAKHFYRPRLESVLKQYSRQFPRLRLFNIDEMFGGWKKAHAAHFAADGWFDQLCRARPR
jgi:sulfate transport system substrate-binding protein